MKKNNLILAREWFWFAGEDELSCEALLKEGGSPITVCFLSQQMAEKYLKGLIIFNGREFEKVHDLIKLANLLKDLLPEIQEFTEDFLILSKYYIESRYPGGSAENYDWSEARKAFEIAKGIKKFVLNQIIP